MSQGYIKFYRKMMESPIWEDPFYFKLWSYCLMKASHKKRQQLIGNQMIELEPGEFVIGRKTLTDDLNRGMKPKLKQSEITWWRYLTNLEKWEMLNIKKTNKYSVVSVVNWSQYQETEHQVNNKRTSDEHQLNTNKNVNNVKNEYSTEFESFWKEYPRKIEKKKSFKSFKTALKNHSLETILQGTKGYAQQVQKNGTENQFIKHASTFLNNDSFMDYLKQDKPEQNFYRRSNNDDDEIGDKIAQMYREG